MNALEFKHLKKYYGLSRGVEDVSFQVHEGEIHGFIGPNGAGKSTVIRVLMGLIYKTSGAVLVFDQEPDANMRKQVGYLPSEVFMYDELTVLEQLKYFARVRGIDDSRMLELASDLDLDLTKKIGDLSFGNKKKVGIVAALMHHPKLIVLDEPTSGLDPLIQQKFFNLLLAEKAKGHTILLSSHVLNEIEKVCDRISLIKAGYVLFTDTLTNIKRSSYKKVTIAPKQMIQLEGLELVHDNKEHLVYSYRGDIHDLLVELTKHKLTSLSITDLDLEEIFMHYYQKESAQDE